MRFNSPDVANRSVGSRIARILKVYPFLRTAGHRTWMYKARYIIVLERGVAEDLGANSRDSRCPQPNRAICCQPGPLDIRSDFRVHGAAFSSTPADAYSILSLLLSIFSEIISVECHSGTGDGRSKVERGFRRDQARAKTTVSESRVPTSRPE